LSLFSSLNCTKSLISLIKDSIDSLKKSITKNIEWIITAGLNTTINHARSSVSEAQVFFLNLEEFVTHSKRYLRELGGSGVGREKIALLIIVILGSRNSSIDSLANIISD